MSLEDHIEKTPDPAAPKKLDLQKCRGLIARAPKFSRLPTGDTIVEFAEQLQLAIAEVGGASTQIVNAQNEAMRYQREAEAANSDVRTANQQLVAVREELRQAKDELMRLKAAAATTETVKQAAEPKKRGPKAKVVPMVVEKKAQ